VDPINRTCWCTKERNMSQQLKGLEEREEGQSQKGKLEGDWRGGYESCIKRRGMSLLEGKVTD